MMPMVLPCQLPWAQGTDTESRGTDIMSPPGPAAQGGAGVGRGWCLWVWLEWGGKVLHGTYCAFPPLKYIFPVWAVASSHQNIPVLHEVFCRVASNCYDGGFCCWSGTSWEFRA